MKIILVLIFATFALMLTSCATLSSDPEKTSENTKPPEEQKAEQEPPEDVSPIVNSGAQSPMQAIAIFATAVKMKDIEWMRRAYSKKTLERFDKMAAEQGKSFYDLVVGEDYEEMSKIPEMRNEKMEGDSGSLELKSVRTGDWQPVPFVKEDGEWKIAIFDKAEDN